MVTERLTGGGSSHALSQYSYDSEGRLTCAAQRMNSSAWGSLPASACTLQTSGSFGPDRITRAVRDANGRVTQVQDAYGTSVQANERTLAYSANGTLAHLIDANLNRTTYEYDGHDRLVKTRLPLPTIGSNSSSTTDYEQLTLDANGNVTQRRLRDGQTLAYTLDALNRVMFKNLPGSEPDVTYGYDLLGRLTSASQSGNSLSFAYDALSRMISETGPNGTVSSTFDVAGRRTRLTYAQSGLYVDHDYDLLGNVLKLRENGATSGVGVLATYAYDNLSRQSSVTFGNGAVRSFTWDNASRLSGLTNNLAGTASDLTQSFSYTPAFQIASVTRSNDAYAWTGHYNQNTTGTPDGLNRLTAYGAKSLSHDARGNVTAFGTRSFGYSSENLLTSGPNSTSLSYDPLLRLYQTSSGSTTVRAGYDGLNRIAEYNGSNALQRRFVHGPGIDEPIVWYEGSGTSTRRFLSADERGSIISVTDGAGAVLGLNKYDEYGMPQSTNLGVFGYTGQAWLPSVGLWHYKARVYDPELGRFLQTDPIGYEDSPNLYAYVLNDPINLVDPLGLTPPCPEADATCTPRPGPTIYVTACSRIYGACWEGPNFPGMPGDEPRVPGAQEATAALMEGLAELASSTTEKISKKARCAGQALANNGLSLALSSAGLISGASPALVLGQLFAGGVSLVVNAFKGDLTGMGISFVGAGLTSAKPLAEQQKGTSKIAKVIPGVGKFVSLLGVGRDLGKAAKDYRKCMGAE